MQETQQNPRDAITGPRARLLELSQARGVSLAALSELLGRNPSYLQQFIRKGSPRKLEEQDRATLARFLGIEEVELRETQENSYVKAPRRRETGDWRRGAPARSGCISRAGPGGGRGGGVRHLPLLAPLAGRTGPRPVAAIRDPGGGGFDGAAAE